MKAVKLDNPSLLVAVQLLTCADPDETGEHIVLADDLMSNSSYIFGAALPLALEALTAVLADESISNAELKGLLNRATDKTWGWEYARIFTPREFLEELKLAIENYLRRHGDVR